jgi:PIF1-like helicase
MHQCLAILEWLVLTKYVCRIRPLKMRPSGSDLLAEMSYDPIQIGRIPIPPIVRDPSILRSPSNASTDYPAAALQESLKNPNFFNVHAILTPTNEAFVKINDDLLGQLLGEVLTFHGDDFGNVDDPDHENMTEEVMATMNCGLSVLRLKIGAPVKLFEIYVRFMTFTTVPR